MIPFKSIRVGPFDLAIKPLESEERDKCLGMFSEIQQAILMRETYSSQQQEAETFLHELLHAIYCVFGVKPKDPEERLISQMSIGMATVIRDNPDAMGWLMASLGNSEWTQMWRKGFDRPELVGENGNPELYKGPKL